MQPKRFLLLSLFAVSTAALASDTVWVTYNGLNTSMAVHVYRTGAHAHVYAGEMNVTVDGATNSAYCVDLDHTITSGVSYEAELVAMPSEAPWCEMSWILANYEATDSASGAAIQTALWKLLYEGEGLYVTPASVDAAGQAIVDEAVGTCPLGCADDVILATSSYAASDGYLYVELEAMRDGVGVPGQAVAVDISAGTLVAPLGGVVETDPDGLARVVVDPAGADVEVDFSMDGRTLYTMVPTITVQQLLAFTYENCTFETSDAWSPTPLGDPRTIGFWKHQARAAVGGPGRVHVDAATLESWLPMEVMGLTVTTLADMADALWLKRATMEQRAQQQCLATLLNVAYGELGWYSDIGGLWLWELWAEAEDEFVAGNPEMAKTICDDINNL